MSVSESLALRKCSAEILTTCPTNSVEKASILPEPESPGDMRTKNSGGAPVVDWEAVLSPSGCDSGEVLLPEAWRPGAGIVQSASGCPSQGGRWGALFTDGSGSLPVSGLVDLTLVRKKFRARE